MEAESWAPPLQAASILSAAAATAEAEALFMSKFGNLSVGGGGGETDKGVETKEAGSRSGAVDDVLKAWMQSVGSACKQTR